RHPTLFPYTTLFRSLSPLAVIWYYQQLSLRDLVRPRRSAMINQQVVEVSVPLPGRLRRFLSESAAQYLNERVIACFRRRRAALRSDEHASALQSREN